MSERFRASVSITVLREGAVLVVTNRRWGGVSLPGGKVDPGEALDDAARRELREETGCEATALRLVACYPHEPLAGDPDRTRWIAAAFLAELDREPRVVEAGTEPSWVLPQELIDRGLYREWLVWWFDLLAKLGELRP